MTSDSSQAPPAPPAVPASPPVSVALSAPSPPVTPTALPRRRLEIRRWAVWCAIGAVAIVIGCFGIRWFANRLNQSVTDNAFVETHIINIASEMVSGRLVRFLVDENDLVKQGQVLAEIDPIHYRDQVKQARGKLDLADAELKRQQAGLLS
jgi:membrane fusion protein (multidrug efflux system)